VPKKLKRYYGLGHLHFITFSCYRRMALAGTVRLSSGHALLAASVLRFQCMEREETAEKLDYMHRNPVMRRLVTDPKDWVWSSYASYSGRGTPLVAIDFLN